MVQDRDVAVGCALVRYQSNLYNSYFVCNYSFVNFVGLPVYVKGTTASQCQTGTNPNYPGLCNENEPVLSNL